ncbi:MAG: alpha/beta hydrolase [Phyllobacteriaceae bacterium]|nr:alpha/beta hydrolase [Phyllobacteriaceae bacterium]
MSYRLPMYDFSQKPVVITRRMLLGGMALGLTGCASQAALLTQDIVKPAPATQMDVLVATLRAPDPDPRIAFSGQRSPALSYAEVTVSVPLNRKPGTVRYPGRSVDLATDFAAVRMGRMNTQTEFVNRLNAQLAVLPAEHRRVFLFVHGYNVNFAAGVFRHAQLMQDYRIPGVAVHFSWASAGGVSMYLYDRDSAELAADGLVRTLELIAPAMRRKSRCWAIPWAARL